jgi:hypothetical protein
VFSSADPQIAAPDEAAVNRGEPLAVVGDIPLGGNPLVQGVFAHRHPNRPAARRRLRGSTELFDRQAGRVVAGGRLALRRHRAPYVRIVRAHGSTEPFPEPRNGAVVHAATRAATA